MHISFNHQFPFILCRLVHNEQYMNREKRYALQYHQQWQLSVSYCTVYNVKTWLDLTVVNTLLFPTQACGQMDQRNSSVFC